MAEENQTQEPTAPEIEKPTVETTQEHKPEQATAETPAPGGAEAEQATEGADKPPRIHGSIQARMDQITRARREAEREAAALRIELEQLRAGQSKPTEGDATPKPPKPAERQAPDDVLIQQRAEQLYRQRIYQERVNSVLSAGNGEYKDFTDRCNIVASLGAGDRPDFMEIITDPAIVPDGHKVIAALADDPNEAARILSLSPVAMSAELARFAERKGKPASSGGRAISKAPAPIRALAATAKAADEPSAEDSEDEFFRKRQAQRAAKKEVRRSL